MNTIQIYSFLKDEMACFALISMTNSFPLNGETVICFKDIKERNFFIDYINTWEHHKAISIASISRSTAIKFLMMQDNKSGINCYVEDDDHEQNELRTKIAMGLNVDLVTAVGFGIITEPLALDPSLYLTTSQPN